MKLLRAIGSGLAGACVMTLVHQTVRKFVPHSPRLDVLGMRAIVRSLRGLGQEPPQGETLYDITFVGDLVSNAAYFSLVGAGDGDNALVKGALLGAGAGLATATLPPALGLGHQPDEKTPQTQVMTVAWYVIGGLVAAGVYQALRSASHD